MVKLKSDPLNIYLILFCLTLLSSCASFSQTVDQTTYENQSTTINNLNKEIERLNQELDDIAGSRANLFRAKSDLEKSMAQELLAGNLSVNMGERGLVVTVLDRVLFGSGQIEVKPSAYETLDKVADVLAQKAHGHMVYIEGHTDNIPIRNSGWRSNWELSTARALEVLHYFIDQKGLDPDRFAATGFGQFQPVSGNQSSEGRMKNRRVEIVISPKKSDSHD